MGNPENQPDPIHLSPSNSGRRTSTASPEFEFLTTVNTSSTSVKLHSADELFVNGLLLPLHLLHLHPNLHKPDTFESQPDPVIEPFLKPDPFTEPPLKPYPVTSKSWKDIFKKGDKIKKKKNPPDNLNNNTSININIWPFSRSSSAGTGSTRPKPNPTRKSSSAPCSRSNSASRKWPSSPGRVGVHLGRASPVWQQARRSKMGGTEAGRLKRVGPPVRVLNVPMCIGPRNYVGCKGEESGPTGGGESLVVGEGTRGGNNMFNFRSMFSKKVY